ncbi:MAG: helix-turn-helix transcriptional regulator [Opitutaceae bacterium]
MTYSMETPAQARAVLKALRNARNLSQAQAGELLGVNQKRIARIEAAPGQTGLAQVAKLVALLGGRLVVEDTRTEQAEKKPAKATW